MMRLLVLFLLIFLQSCASGFKERSYETFNTAQEGVQYYLSDVPQWMNFSSAGGCFREHPIHYLNYESVGKSFGLNYDQVTQLQLTLNYYAENRLLGELEKNNLFFDSLQKIQNKVFVQTIPSFNRIHLIWLDEALNNPLKMSKLKQFLTSGTQNSGVPVIISTCLGFRELEKMFPEMGIKFISAEFFSIYQKDLGRQAHFLFDLSALFKKEQKIYFYQTEKNNRIDFLVGPYEILKY